MSLSREFRIKEGQGLELRADAFNLTNSFVPAMAGSPGGTSPVTQFSTAYGNPLTGPTFSLINSAQFGQILGAQLTRKIQFALNTAFSELPDSLDVSAGILGEGSVSCRATNNVNRGSRPWRLFVLLRTTLGCRRHDVFHSQVNDHASIDFVIVPVIQGQ